MTFDLTLDPGRLSPRATFEETKTRNLTRVRILGLRQYCETVKLLFQVKGPQSPRDGAILRLGKEEVGCALVFALAQHLACR